MSNIDPFGEEVAEEENGGIPTKIIIPILTIAAALLGFVGGLVVAFCYRNCNKKSAASDEEGAVREPTSTVTNQEYLHRGYERQEVTRVTQYSDRYSGVYDRISQFDVPVLTEESSTQTEDADYVYIQDVKNDVIANSSSTGHLQSQSSLKTDQGSTCCCKDFVTRTFASWEAFSMDEIFLRDHNSLGFRKLSLGHVLEADKCNSTVNMSLSNLNTGFIVIKARDDVQHFLQLHGLSIDQRHIQRSMSVSSNGKREDETNPKYMSRSLNTSCNVDSTVLAKSETDIENGNDYFPMTGENSRNFFSTRSDQCSVDDNNDNYLLMTGSSQQPLHPTDRPSSFQDDNYFPMGSQKCVAYIQNLASHVCNKSQEQEADDYIPMAGKHCKEEKESEDLYLAMDNVLHEDNDDYIPMDLSEEGDDYVPMERDDYQNVSSMKRTQVQHRDGEGNTFLISEKDTNYLTNNLSCRNKRQSESDESEDYYNVRGISKGTSDICH